MRMNSDRRQFISSSLFAVGMFSVPAPAPDEVKDGVKASGETQILSLRGKAGCVTEEFQKPYQITPDCEKRGHFYALKTADGKFYPFLPVDTAAAVWMDERVRERDLQITARIFPATDFIEAIKFQSWREGKLHDIYYFCDVCNISSHKPGPCECCQEPFEFRETPADDNHP
ncbi:MAG TPA: hypothetical protein VI479_11555 [Blastocatellia bacterium]